MILSIWHVPRGSDYFCPKPSWETVLDGITWWNELHHREFFKEYSHDWARIRIA